MIRLTIPAVVALAGAVVHLVAPGKWADLGKMAFGAGLLALLL